MDCFTFRQLSSCNTQGIQCNLLENKNYWLRFAKLQQKLVKFSEAADLMKSQLEAMCDVIDPSIGKSKKFAFFLTDSREIFRSVHKTQLTLPL